MTPYHNTSLIRQAMQWAHYERDHSTNGNLYHELEPELPNLRTLAAQLRDIDRWPELIESHPIQRVTTTYPNDPEESLIDVSVPPFAHLCLRYLVVATLARRLSYTFMARIGRRLVHSHSPRSPFFGTTAAAVAEINAWNARQRIHRPWTLSFGIDSIHEIAEIPMIGFAVRELNAMHPEPMHYDVHAALDILEFLLRAPIAELPESDEGIAFIFPLRESGLLRSVACDRFFVNCLLHNTDHILVSSGIPFVRHSGLINAHHRDPDRLYSLAAELQIELDDRIRLLRHSYTLDYVTPAISPNGAFRIGNSNKEPGVRR